MHGGGAVLGTGEGLMAWERTIGRRSRGTAAKHTGGQRERERERQRYVWRERERWRRRELQRTEADHGSRMRHLSNLSARNPVDTCFENNLVLASNSVPLITAKFSASLLLRHKNTRWRLFNHHECFDHEALIGNICDTGTTTGHKRYRWLHYNPNDSRAKGNDV